MSDGSDTEDLEQRVAELEATVRGLTEELVDATERVRELERDAGMHDSTSEKRARRQRTNATPESSDADAQATESVEGDTDKKAEGEDATDSEESTSDDIIVA